MSTKHYVVERSCNTVLSLSAMRWSRNRVGTDDFTLGHQTTRMNDAFRDTLALTLANFSTRWKSESRTGPRSLTVSELRVLSAGAPLFVVGVAESNTSRCRYRSGPFTIGTYNWFSNDSSSVDRNIK